MKFHPSHFILHTFFALLAISHQLSASEIKISQLPEATTAASSDITIVVTGTTTKKMTLANLANALPFSVSNITLANGAILIGGTDGVAHAQTVSADATIGNDGGLVLASVATSGTHSLGGNGQVVIDAKGRTLSITDPTNITTSGSSTVDGLTMSGSTTLLLSGTPSYAVSSGSAALSGTAVFAATSGTAAMANALVSGSVGTVTLTQPVTGATITIADGKTFVSQTSVTIAGSDGAVLVLNSGTNAPGADFDFGGMYNLLNVLDITGSAPSLDLSANAGVLHPGGMMNFDSGAITSDSSGNATFSSITASASPGFNGSGIGVANPVASAYALAIGGDFLSFPSGYFGDINGMEMWDTFPPTSGWWLGSHNSAQGISSDDFIYMAYNGSSWSEAIRIVNATRHLLINMASEDGSGAALQTPSLSVNGKVTDSADFGATLNLSTNTGVPKVSVLTGTLVSGSTAITDAGITGHHPWAQNNGTAALGVTVSGSTATIISGSSGDTHTFWLYVPSF